MTGDDYDFMLHCTLGICFAWTEPFRIMMMVKRLSIVLLSPENIGAYFTYLADLSYITYWLLCSDISCVHRSRFMDSGTAS